MTEAESNPAQDPETQEPLEELPVQDNTTQEEKKTLIAEIEGDTIELDGLQTQLKQAGNLLDKTEEDSEARRLAQENYDEIEEFCDGAKENLGKKIEKLNSL